MRKETTYLFFSLCVALLAGCATPDRTITFTDGRQVQRPCDVESYGSYRLDERGRFQDYIICRSGEQYEWR